MSRALLILALPKVVLSSIHRCDTGLQRIVWVDLRAGNWGPGKGRDFQRAALVLPSGKPGTWDHMLMADRVRAAT